MMPTNTLTTRMLTLIGLASAPPAPVTVGPNTPDVASTSDPGSGQNWTNPGNIVADDGSYATCSVTTGQTSDWLIGTDYDFAIPAGATINWVALVVPCHVATGDEVVILDAKLVVGGSIVGTNKADPSLNVINPGSDTDQAVPPSGPASTWGNALTAELVNAVDFGVAIRISGQDVVTLATASVDTLALTVNYTPA